MSDELDNEQRLVELETRIAFQDHIIDDLNGVITSQQEQIDQIESELIAVKSQFKAILSDSGDIDGG